MVNVHCKPDNGADLFRSPSMLDILVVDDEAAIRQSVAEVLRASGHRVTVAGDGAEAQIRLGSHAYDLMVTDIRLPEVDGLTLFRRVKKESPMTDVILITAFGAVAEAVGALKEGANDYLTKPVDLDEIALRVQRIDERRSVKRELEQAKAGIAGVEVGPIVFGRSPAMTRLYYLIDTFAQSDAPLLVLGESGTGKELASRRVHELGARRSAPFVAVNCAAFPDTLLEAELFGHERGAFTGAIRKRDGRFRAADRGTIFLDEVAELSMQAQAKLLRVLQEGSFEPLGTDESTSVDVRVISATHRNLKERITQGRFREDLYYRLKVLSVELTPIRERRGDMPILVQHLLLRGAARGEEVPQISARAWAALMEYPFPGNVRELEHVLLHASIMARSRDAREIDVEDLPSELTASTGSESVSSGTFLPLSLALAEFEREYVARGLRLAGGRKTRASELLGISRKALWKKIKTHSIGGNNRRRRSLNAAADDADERGAVEGDHQPPPERDRQDGESPKAERDGDKP